MLTDCLQCYLRLSGFLGLSHTVVKLRGPLSGHFLLLPVLCFGPLSYLLFTWSDLANRFVQLVEKWFWSVLSQVIFPIYFLIAFEIISYSYNQNRFGQTEGVPNQPSQDASCGPALPLAMWLWAGHWNASDIKLLICNVGVEVPNGQSCYEKQMAVSLNPSYKSPNSGINMKNCVFTNSYIFLIMF